MIYKLQHNDIIKPLPIITNSGVKPYLVTECYYINSTKIIYDTPNSLLKRALLKKTKREMALSMSTGKYQKVIRYFLCIYHDKQIKFTYVGRQLMDKLMEGYKTHSPFWMTPNNLHLKIDIKLMHSVYPNYDNSKIIESDFDIDNNDYLQWIKDNQPFYIEDFIKRNDVYANKIILEEEGLYEYITDVIADDREEKINQVING